MAWLSTRPTYPDSLAEPEYRDDVSDASRKRSSTGVYHGERMRMQQPPSQRVRHYKRRPIYVAATKQHVGKTTTSLALMSGLSKRFEKVGFIKPVGQQHVPVEVPVDPTGENDAMKTIRVDKDVCLVREHFQLTHCPYPSMSPCLIGSGYTKQFIDGDIQLHTQLDDIVKAFREIDDASDVVLCEGTGHAGVGSVVGASNAKVASMLGADMILVANGGLGKTTCGVAWARSMCYLHVSYCFPCCCYNFAFFFPLITRINI